ncbi:MAG: class I SAM-dependent methyltransferase [Actinomycetota bacterium]|nr:class I SAM-dependent methyltransferase [Actinomycetota bacterium]
MAAPATAEAIRDVNTRYHDDAAAEYDAKWGIDFGPGGLEQVMGKLGKILPRDAWPFSDALEVGAGTGYFSLNLLLGGQVGRATCTDISPGMIGVLEGNAARLGLDVDAVACDAERLPFDDGSFDLVLGHAVLHHLPDLDTAFSEFFRVLRPGGWVAFCGEPSRVGDQLAGVPKQAAWRASPVWRRLMGAVEAVHPGQHGDAEPGLEHVVDVHAFRPDDLVRHARAGGFEDVRVRGEELLASWFGWANRALEATAEPDSVPWAWKQYAYRGYLLLQQVDRRLLEGRLPPAIFYNLMVAARRP